VAALLVAVCPLQTPAPIITTQTTSKAFRVAHEVVSLMQDPLGAASIVVRHVEALLIVDLFVAEAVSSFRRVEWRPSDTLKWGLGNTAVNNALIANEANGAPGVYHDRRTTVKAYTAKKQAMLSACVKHCWRTSIHS